MLRVNLGSRQDVGASATLDGHYHGSGSVRIVLLGLTVVSIPLIQVLLHFLAHARKTHLLVLGDFRRRASHLAMERLASDNAL